MESYLAVLNGDVSAILDGDSKKNYSIRYHCIPTQLGTSGARIACERRSRRLTVFRRVKVRIA